MAIIMSGVPVANSVEDEVRRDAKRYSETYNRKPGLATILVGSDSSSANYINMKQKKASELGFHSPHKHLNDNSTTKDLIEVVESFNEDELVDAMLIQYPPPKGVDFEEALYHVNPDKDADGMHPLNMGRLALSMPGPIPCTPAGIEAILAFYSVQVSGRHVVIVGRGLTLGKPLSLLLSQKRDSANAAVTLVHSGVSDLKQITLQADILISAAGVPGIVSKDMVRRGAVVVGAGVRYEGKKLLPDVNEDVEEVASYITPRVGGVGPTTVAMLFRNAISSAFRLKELTK